MSDIGVYSILAAAVELIRSDGTYGPRMSNCWLPAATWVEALRRTCHVDAFIIIDVRKFNASMLKSRSFGSVMTRFDGSNPAGVFQIKFKHQFFYYFTDQERQVEYPRPLNGAWKERVLEVAANVLAIPSTRARPALLESTTNSLENGDISGQSIAVPSIDGDEQQSPNKRQRINDVASYQVQLLASYWPDSPEAN